MRVTVFALIAIATAWLSSRRRRAEEAQRKSLNELEAAINTLRKVSGWPVLIAADTATSVRRMLEHAANVVGAAAAAAIWEAEEEPWLHFASSRPADGGAVTRHSPIDLPPLDEPLPEEFARARRSAAARDGRLSHRTAHRPRSASPASNARPATRWRS